jgi:hypothetical protein
MPINTCHPTYANKTERWRRNRDALAGQDAIHRGGVRYLPDDNNGKEPERYQRLLERATFTRFTGYTLEGLVGAVFRKPATSDIPDAMAYMLEDANGSGRSLEQVGKEVVGELLIVDRVGILAEYPAADEGLSAEQVSSLGLRPKLTLYDTENIDNWRYEFKGGTLRLTMIKLKELAEIDQDDYATTSECRYRVLKMQDGVYTQSVFNESGQLIEGPFVPRQASGQTWDRIPFHFAGANTNMPEPGEAPLSGIVDLNISHYQVTADKRQNLHVHSGGLLVISSDMSSEEFRQQNPNGITVGVNSGVFLGSAGKAELLQLDASSASQTEIESIQNQLVAVGARLITAQGGNQTAEAARIAASAESSALSNLVGNASEAIEAALEDCALFAGADPALVKFNLNREFFDTNLDPQAIMALIALGDRGIIAITDQRHKLRDARWIAADRTDEEIESEVVVQPDAGI